MLQKKLVDFHIFPDSPIISIKAQWAQIIGMLEIFAYKQTSDFCRSGVETSPTSCPRTKCMGALGRVNIWRITICNTDSYSQTQLYHINVPLGPFHQLAPTSMGNVTHTPAWDSTKISEFPFPKGFSTNSKRPKMRFTHWAHFQRAQIEPSFLCVFAQVYNTLSKNPKFHMT